MAIIHETQTKYHSIKVVENNLIRTMLFGNGLCAEQSAINIQKPNEHVFDYSFLAMHSLLITPYPVKILVVGLGGGIIPTEMEKYTSAKIDVIEIDPEVVKIAKEYFLFKETERIKVYIGDAFDATNKLKEKYDIVVVDAFFTDYTPLNIMSKEFYKTIFNITSDKGVVVVNTANICPYFNSQVNTIRSVFGDVIYNLNGTRNENTTMLFVLKKDIKMLQLHARPLCHFLVVQPWRFKITDKIKNAKIISMSEK